MNYLKMCWLWHQRIRWEWNDVVTNSRQGFTLWRKTSQYNYSYSTATTGKKFFFWELSENKRIIYFLALGNLQVVKELESQEWELKWTENIHVNKTYMHVQLFWPKYFIMHWEYLSTWINFSTLTVCSLKKKKKVWWTSTHL